MELAPSAQTFLGGEAPAIEVHKTFHTVLYTTDGFFRAEPLGNAWSPWQLSVWVMCLLSLQRFPYWLKASPYQFIQLMEVTAIMSRRVTPPKLEERHQCSLAPPLAHSTAPDTHRYPPAWLSLCLKLSSQHPHPLPHQAVGCPVLY